MPVLDLVFLLHGPYLLDLPLDVLLLDGVLLLPFTGSDIKDHLSLFLLLAFGESAAVAPRARPAFSTIPLLVLVFAQLHHLPLFLHLALLDGLIFLSLPLLS